MAAGDIDEILELQTYKSDFELNTLFRLVKSSGAMGGVLRRLNNNVTWVDTSIIPSFQAILCFWISWHVFTGQTFLHFFVLVVSWTFPQAVQERFKSSTWLHKTSTDHNLYTFKLIRGLLLLIIKDLFHNFKRNSICLHFDICEYLTPKKNKKIFRQFSEFQIFQSFFSSVN